MDRLCFETLKKQGYAGFLLQDAPERVVQFGEGNFLRAFADHFIDEMNEKAGFNTKVVLVQPRGGHPEAADRFAEQDGLYTLILRGRENERILALRLTEQSTFGIMKGTRPSEIREILEKLEELEYIRSEGAGLKSLKINPLSYPVLRGTEKLKIKRSRKISTRSEKPRTDGVSLELFEALKAVRTEFARKRGVPPFVIFSDTALLEMCRVRPQTDGEFLSVSSVGEKKLERYGEAFMKVIRRFERD